MELNNYAIQLDLKFNVDELQGPVSLELVI